MSFQELVKNAQAHFPKLKIKYQKESLLTKLISVYSNNIYFSDQKFIKHHPISAQVILLHEVVHLYDKNKIGRILFLFSYFFPQILSPFFLLLTIFLTWKITIPLTIFFLLPIPSFFRMHWEKRAYFTSLYVIKKLSDKLKFNPHLDIQKNIFLENFKNASYYYMYPFVSIKNQFNQALKLVNDNKQPFQDPIFEILDDLIIKS